MQKRVYGHAAGGKATRGTTQRREMLRVMSGEAHLRGLAPGQHSFEETPQRWRAGDDAVSNLPVWESNPRSQASTAMPLTTMPDIITIVVALPNGEERGYFDNRFYILMRSQRISGSKFSPRPVKIEVDISSNLV